MGLGVLVDTNLDALVEAFHGVSLCYVEEMINDLKGSLLPV